MLGCVGTFPHGFKGTQKGGREMIFLPREEGQGLTEYGMVIVLVAIVVVLVLALIGPTVGNMFSTVVSSI
jgi:pilus assembly protein Flp/PilA